MYPLTSVFVALAVTMVGIIMLCPMARSIGLVAHPGGHRKHSGLPCLIGGVAILLGVTAGCMVQDLHNAWPVPVLLWGALFLAFVGVVDDWREIPSVLRFTIQGIAAYAMVEIGNVWLIDLGRLTGEELFSLGRWAVPLSVFAVVGVINAINMSDGMDGLASTLVLVALVALLYLTLATGDTYSVALIAIVAASVFGFWVFNARVLRRTPASVYMGDSGSTVLGWILAWFLIDLSQGPERTFAPVTALWLVALPLFDAVGVMVRRALRGLSPFAADRRHYHHYLLAAGLTVNQTLLVVVVTALILASIGIMGEHLSIAERYLFFAFLGVFALYVLIMEYLDRMTTLSERTETVEAEPV